MEMKIFRGIGVEQIDALEKAVNDFLKTLPADMQIRGRDIAHCQVGDQPSVVIALWWSPMRGRY